MDTKHVLNINATVVVAFRPPSQMRCEFRWYSTDPLAVTVTFFDDETEMETEWVVSRDLFLDCLVAPIGHQFGSGDVMVERGQYTFMMRVGTEPGNRATTIFDFVQIGEFFKRTVLSVPRNPDPSENYDHPESELLFKQIDLFLEDFLP